MRNLFLAFTFLFLFSSAGCSAQENPTSPQEISAEQENPYSWDFGNVQENKVLKHEFLLKNDTANILTIKDITSSCGCTVSQVRQKILSPGESTTLEVSFDSKGYSGPVEQYIYINTDNLDNPVLRYIIKANVIK